MRTSTSAGLLVSALAATSAAQYLNETGEFQLVVLSSNAIYNGSKIGACHSGAGVEALCLNAGASQVYHQNYSASQTIDPAVGTRGYLVYNLLVGTGNNETIAVQSPMVMAYNLFSNVVVPTFTISESYGTEIAFNDQNLMTIPSWLDDTVSPKPSYKTGGLQNWYICETYTGEPYTSLAWKMGEFGAPQNPTCVSATVKRVFTTEPYPY